jgi:hypothetical protein
MLTKFEKRLIAITLPIALLLLFVLSLLYVKIEHMEDEISTIVEEQLN